MATKQRLRSDINELDKWDLSKIYSSIEEFNTDYKYIEKEIDKLHNYEGKLMESAKNLYDYLELDFNISRKCSKLSNYARLHNDEDTTNSFYQELYGRVLNLYVKIDKVEAFAIPEMLKFDYSKIEEFYKEYSDLKKYEINLKNIYRYKKYTLSEESEKLLSSLGKVFSTAGECYESLTDSDIKFGDLIGENGEEVELTDSNYSIFIRSKDRNVRKQAFEMMYKVYEGYKNTIASALKGDVEASAAISEIRGYNSALEASLYEDNVPVDVYNNLINTVSNNLEPLFKYYKLKKEILNLDEIHLYDIYAELVQEKSKNYSFIEAKEIVINALSVLGEDYITDLKTAFKNRWIDIYNNVGKRGGAYSSGGYDTYPYILLNFEGSLNDVSTLAHELGHSMHSFYSIKNNPYNCYSYKIFVAEVASTVNELLLNNYLLNKTDDKEEKLSILNNLLELFKSTIYRQTMFAEFEKTIYEACENGEVLTNELMSNIYYDLNKKYFGNDVVIDNQIRYEWERVPHFFYNFYVYKYATSLSASCYIVEGILNNKEGALENYLKFLTLGGSMDPIDELKVAGVDITDPKVVESAIKMFDKTIEDFKNLHNS